MNDIGDDLIEARHFATSTMAAMDILLSDARLNAGLSHSTLANIQEQAVKLQARGIYRAAQSALDCYASACSQPKIDGRLMTLYKLVTQYTQGLDEIAPIISENTLAEQNKSLETIHAQARETLMPLLKFAGDSSFALKRLAELPMDTSAKTPPSNVSFESLMPDVTNSALRTARSQGKSVSISYAADGLAIADSQVETVRGQLEDIVTHLVRTRIASPNARLTKGLSRAGHIDISAKETAKGLDISVMCDDETVTLFPKVEGIDASQSQSDIVDMSWEVTA